MAAKTRPYMRAAFVSNGNGSQVWAAHWSRSWRRARSSSLRVAWGPAANSARVTAAIADSSGKRSTSIVSISITTDVSSIPRVGAATVSAIDGLIYRRIHIFAELHGVDARCARRSLGNDRPGCESPGMDWAEFGDRISVAGHDEGVSPPDLPEHGRRCIAKLALADGLVHAYERSTLATLWQNTEGLRV